MTTAIQITWDEDRAHFHATNIGAGIALSAAAELTGGREALDELRNLEFYIDELEASGANTEYDIAELQSAFDSLAWTAETWEVVQP